MKYPVVVKGMGLVDNVSVTWVVEMGKAKLMKHHEEIKRLEAVGRVLQFLEDNNSKPGLYR